MGGVYMFTYVHICVGVKGEHWVFSSITVYLIFETRSLNLSSMIRIRLAIQQATRDLPVSFSSGTAGVYCLCPAFYMVLKD